MPVLVYELNEVPWDVVDTHVRRRPDGALARVVSGGACFTTMVGPEALHPWISWPTMHRGTEEHGVQFLGQAPSAVPAIWDVALAAGRTVGVFGALPSWPPAPGASFHVPDLFAPDDACVPAALEPFQAFCRGQAATVEAPLSLGSSVAAVPGLLRRGVRMRTVATAARLALAARREPVRHAFLPLHASELALDVFLACWRRHRPDYSSFFSNHVAWALHHYRRAAEPERYPEGRGGDDPRLAGVLPAAMDLADAQLGRLLQLDPSVVVVVAASLGQAPGVGGPRLGALRLTRPTALLEACGITGPVARRPAMEPDVPLQFADPDQIAPFVARAERLVDRDGAPLFTLLRRDDTVLVRVGQQHAALVHQVFRAGSSIRPLSDLGLTHVPTDTPCTGVHTPEGILTFYGRSIRRDRARTVVAATRYAPTVLALLDVPVPPSMRAEPLAL